MIDKARQAVSALEMSAVKDMSVEKAEELREVVYQTLDQAEKNEKVLEILKKKRVNIIEIKYWFGLKSPRYEFTYPEYCRVYCYYEDYYDVIPLSKEKLTETEFNLIKEWLCKE